MVRRRLSGSPDADLYVGVSNLYLQMAEIMGVAGVGVFLAVVVSFLQASGERDAGVLTRDGGLSSGPGGGGCRSDGGGLLDHYLFNLVYPHMSVLFWVYLGVAWLQAIWWEADALLLPAGQRLHISNA